MDYLVNSIRTRGVGIEWSKDFDFIPPVATPTKNTNKREALGYNITRGDVKKKIKKKKKKKRKNSRGKVFCYSTFLKLLEVNRSFSELEKLMDRLL